MDTPELEQNDDTKSRPGDDGYDEGYSGNSSENAEKLEESSFVGSFVRAQEVELWRTVKVRVGNETIETPLIQEVMRQVGEAALKGDRRAQLELMAQYRADKKWLTQGNNDWHNLSVLSDDELAEFMRLSSKTWVGPKPKATPEELRAQRKREAEARKQQEEDAERHRVLQEIRRRDRERGLVILIARARVSSPPNPPRLPRIEWTPRGGA